MKAICFLSILSGSLSFMVPTHHRIAIVANPRLRMGYLDDLSPQQPDNDNATDKLPPPINNKPSGVIPCGRGPLGSYLDAVTSGAAASSSNSKEDDVDVDDNDFVPSPAEAANKKKSASWSGVYLTNFLTGDDKDDARTDIRNLLTQRSIQSFMRLLEECRDPHSAKWIQEGACDAAFVWLAGLCCAVEIVNCCCISSALFRTK